MIRIERLRIAGPLLLRPDVVRDVRGFFAETLRASDLAGAGITDDFVQDSHSRSVRATLRGLHYLAPPGQAKIVRVARGAIHDVVLDIRRDSATFGQHLSVRLDDADLCGLFIPSGFAHGFCVVSELADILYRTTRYYQPDFERGVAWNDPALGIEWPTAEPILSERDQNHPRLSELRPD